MQRSSDCRRRCLERALLRVEGEAPYARSGDDHNGIDDGEEDGKLHALHLNSVKIKVKKAQKMDVMSRDATTMTWRFRNKICSEMETLVDVRSCVQPSRTEGVPKSSSTAVRSGGTYGKRYCHLVSSFRFSADRGRIFQRNVDRGRSLMPKSAAERS
jgi:hypothetical protein